MNNIIEVDLNTDKQQIRIKTPYQFDNGLMLRLKNVPDHPDGSQLLVEMCNFGDERIRYDFPYSGDDIEIPADLLTDGRDLQFFVSVKAAHYFSTLFEINVRTTKRPSR